MTNTAALKRFGLPLSDEQLGLHDAVSAFAAERLAPGAAERDRTREFPGELVREMAGMGLMAVKVPSAEGGAGADTTAYVLAMEALAEADASCAVVVAASNLCAGIITKAGAPSAPSFCLSEPQTGSDAAALATTGVRDGGDWVLNGSKMWITSGAHAGIYLVFAKTDPAAGAEGVSCFLVEQGAKGLVIGKEEMKMGQRASGTVGLFLEDCRVPAGHMIGAPGQGYRLALAALGAGRVGISGLCLGIAEAAMREGLRYATTRKAFGTRIADFQHTQFVLADSRVELDMAWLMTLRAARLLDDGDPARVESSMAKVVSSETCCRVVDRMLQLHGGYGYSEEYAIERLYRDARVTRIYEGTNEIQRTIVARELLKDA